jgi:hypothetical protein
MINLKRDGVKSLSNFNIDSQIIVSEGSKIFNYQGEITPEFQNICLEFLKVVEDARVSLDQIMLHIPTNKNAC